MRDDLAAEDDASTSLTADERQGLIPSYITSRQELNEAEQHGIAVAEHWAFSRRRDVLDEKFLKRLHREMFGEVWKWAGNYRVSGQKNLGVEIWQIPVEMRKLLDDTRFWIESKTHGPDEIVVRFHHRLVQIHPFPNGNGRHARLAADLLAVRLGQPRMTWGSSALTGAGETRNRYIAALRAADRHDIAPLLEFARS